MPHFRSGDACVERGPVDVIKGTTQSQGHSPKRETTWEALGTRQLRFLISLALASCVRAVNATK